MEIIDSFNISTLGIVIVAKLSEEGLPSGAIVQSKTTGHTWMVKYRMLFQHVGEQHKLFENESVSYIKSSFKSPEDQANSEKKILEQEAQNIFQYRLTPVGESTKPAKGTILKIMKIPAATI